MTMNAQIQQLYEPLFHYVRKRINVKEDAEDITQEVFLKLSKSDLEKVNNVKSWVYTIAKNTITDFYRKKKLPLENETTEVADLDYNDDSAVEDLSNCVASYVSQMPADYRDIMRMSELENKPQKEIAKKLDMNYVTLRSKIQRGRKKLKDMFTDCCSVSQGGKGSIMDFEQKGNCGESC